jgi:hypothetical protein
MEASIFQEIFDTLEASFDQYSSADFLLILVSQQ